MRFNCLADIRQPFSSPIIQGRQIKELLKMYLTAKNMQRAGAMTLISFFCNLRIVINQQQYEQYAV